VPGRVLLPVAFGILLVLTLIWIDSPIGPHKTSAVAHAIVGTLVGWGVAETLRHRTRDRLSVALQALSVVIALTLVWELGEYAGDRLFGTALNPSLRNSAEDVLFGTAGGLVGITFASVVTFWRRDV
jgi:hypothetical protein